MANGHRSWDFTRFGVWVIIVHCWFCGEWLLSQQKCELRYIRYMFCILGIKQDTLGTAEHVFILEVGIFRLLSSVADSG